MAAAAFMRCICGRVVRTPWRFYRDLALATAAILWGCLLARPHADAISSQARALAVGDSLRARLDSVRAGRWVQVQDGDTVVAVIRARRWPWREPH